MAGETAAVEPEPRAFALLRQLVLALGVFLGGLAMTAAWIALFFTGPDEPAAKHVVRDPVAVRPAAPRLLWLIFDAMRVDAAFDARLMPNLARLRQQGTWGIARTGTFTMTGTCVRALSTGVQPRPTHVIHNFRSPPIRGDSLFHRVKRAGKRIVLIGDHIWVDLFRNTVNESYPQPDLGIEDVHRTDRAALRDVRRHLPRRWDLAVIHLVGSDHAAHKDRGVRGLYRRKLAEYDGLIPELRRLMGPGAAVLVMADHSCNRVGNHGAGELEAMRAPYVLAGPGVRAAGRVDTDQRSMAPTITALLGVPAPWGAEKPGLLRALRFTPAERTTLLFNHAFQRRAHLRRLLGRPVPTLDHLLTAASTARQEGRLKDSRGLSRRLIGQATRLREAEAAASPFIWVAAGSLLFVVPVLLLLGGRSFPGPLSSVAALALVGAAVAATFAWGSRPGVLIGAALLALLAAWGLVQSRLRWTLARRALLVVGIFLFALVAGWTVDFVLRAVRGDPVGRLWAVWPALLLAGAAAVIWRRGLARVLSAEPALWVAGLGALLLLPLPALRWWGGRHVLFALLGLALVLGLLVWTWKKRQEHRRALARVVMGVGALVLLLGLGLFTRAWESRQASPALAWLLLAVTPAVLALVATDRDLVRGLVSFASLVALAVWIVASLPRLFQWGDPSYLVILVVLSIVVVIARRGHPVHLLLLCLALFRLLADDPAVAAMALFGVGLLGLARRAWPLEHRLAPGILALCMTLLELTLFDQLGRNFSFGTIDVTVGFVGGGELDLWRITVLVLASYAVPWWLLWAAVQAVPGSSAAGLARVHVCLLWLLAVKLLGTFLIFLGRPAHFWMIHSLIPFQFFALCHLVLILLGFVAVYALHWRRAGTA